MLRRIAFLVSVSCLACVFGCIDTDAPAACTDNPEGCLDGSLDGADAGADVGHDSRTNDSPEFSNDAGDSLADSADSLADSADSRPDSISDSHGDADTSGDADTGLDVTSETDAGCAGVCSPGATRTVSCGKCGSEVDTCSSSCTWIAGSCTGETGVCAPTDTRMVACGHCGTETDTCSATCAWTAGTCTGEGCAPGTTVATGGTCPSVGDVEYHTCNSSCAYDAPFCGMAHPSIQQRGLGP